MCHGVTEPPPPEPPLRGAASSASNLLFLGDAVTLWRTFIPATILLS
jgi:hypothetical protein